MASKRRALLILITALCLTAPASLWAQNPGYYTELRFVQRLTWVGDEYATRYEVIIEKEEDGKYKRAHQEFTTAFFIEVSLSPGKYRYQVIPYDFFNIPVPVTEWMNFEVLRGSKPANPDLIILRDGNVIEAKVMDKQASGIMYKRFDNPDGQLLSIPLDNVLSIRYEDGTVEIIYIEPKKIAVRHEIYALDPDKLAFGLSIDPVGLIFNGGALILEFTKGKFNSQINLLTPAIGLASFRGSGVPDWEWPTYNWVGIGLCFSYFHPSRLGGFYIGGLIEYSYGESFYNDRYDYYDKYNNVTNTSYDRTQYFLNNLAIAINTGYKFITRSGIYFHTGAAVGVSFDGMGGDKFGVSLVLRPDLTIGYYFQKKNFVILK